MGLTRGVILQLNIFHCKRDVNQDDYSLLSLECPLIHFWLLMCYSHLISFSLVFSLVLLLFISFYAIDYMILCYCWLYWFALLNPLSFTLQGWRLWCPVLCHFTTILLILKDARSLFVAVSMTCFIILMVVWLSSCCFRKKRKQHRYREKVFRCCCDRGLWWSGYTFSSWSSSSTSSFHSPCASNTFMYKFMVHHTLFLRTLFGC